MWLSLVERLVWDQDAAGSNPVIPTTLEQSTLCSVFLCQEKHPLASLLLLFRKKETYLRRLTAAITFLRAYLRRKIDFPM